MCLEEKEAAMMEKRIEGLRILMAILLLLEKAKRSTSLDWEQIHCSTDALAVTEGTASDMGRFPWLGVIQHSFDIGGQTQYAITSAILVHPGYAIAPAEDIAKIPVEQIANGTKLILWRSTTEKYAVDVTDYILHPEFSEGRTRASLALLELEPRGETGGAGDNSDTVLPICLPHKGVGSFSDIYVAKMREENLELQKEVFKMSFVDSPDCEEFYFSNKLNSKMMSPSFPTCAKVERDSTPCVWDGGAALITRQSWGHWLLLGFGVRGAGCGAPSRFLNIHDYMPWINDLLSSSDDEPDDGDVWHRFGVRRASPIKIYIYPLDQIMPWGWGQCEKGERGSVLFKESLEVVSSKSTGQGFYYVAVSQIATFSCASVNMEEVTAKSNAAVWIEHDCHREQLGLAGWSKRPPEYWKDQCFLYFKSTASIEFRFYFSFRAMVEMTLYGTEEPHRGISIPMFRYETTDAWWPTEDHLRWYDWGSRHKWWWHM